MWERLANGIVNSLRKAWGFLHKPVPGWLRQLCVLIGNLVFSFLKEAGKSYIRSIEHKIIEISKEYPDASGDEKFNMVWDFAHTLNPNWKESSLDTLIQNLFIALKRTNRI